MQDAPRRGRRVRRTSRAPRDAPPASLGGRLLHLQEPLHPRAEEAVAAQEYLAQDAERYMPVERVSRTKDKISRAYWLQAYFENGQILFPDRNLVADYKPWQALMDELLLFPQAEHDDLFDGLQTMVEGVTEHDRKPPMEVI